MPDLGLNILDFLLLFIMFIGLLVGLLRGIGPQLMSLASIWLAVLASLWTYRLLSVNIFIESDMFGQTSADAMSFAIMFIVFFHGIRLIIRYLSKPPEEKKKKPRKRGQVGPAPEVKRSTVQRFVVGPLLAIGGMVMGLVLTVLWTSIILGVTQFFYRANIEQASGVDVPGSGLVNQISSSALVPYFNRVLWLLVSSVDLFVFDERANILKQVICSVFPDSC